MMNTPLTRRTFVQHLGAAGAALAAAPIAAAAARAAEPAGKTILAVVGCAHSHTPGYIQMLKARKDVQVKYVWDNDAQRAKKWADELGAAAVPDDAAVWADPQVKGAVVCSQTNLHQRLALAAAKAGKNLFVEKPMGVSAAECRRMAEAIEQAGLLFTTGYGMRTTPEHLFLKQQITQGTLGKITRIRGSVCHSGSLGHWFDGEWRWMADPKIAGCGGFGDLGTHLLDILMWLIGDVEAVTADIKVVTGRYGPCDECGEALIRFKSGVTGTLAAGWVDVANPLTLEISGTEGHAAIFEGKLYFKAGKVAEADGQKPWTKLPPPLPPPLEMFIAALAGKPNLGLVTPREAAARVSVMEAMYRSSAGRRWESPA
jgi:predicted dehydrogenase